MGIQQFRINSGPIAADGTATATGRLIKGEILSVEVNYPTNTCTVDLDSQEAITQKIVDLAADNTDKVVYPRVALEDNTGTDLDLSDTEGGDTAVYGHFVVHGRLKLTIASGTEDDEVVVFVNVQS